MPGRSPNEPLAQNTFRTGAKRDIEDVVRLTRPPGAPYG